MLYERLKRFDEAAADFRQIVADPLTQKNLRDIVASHLIDAELNRVTAAANALVKDKEFVAARTLVTKAIDEATDAALKTELGNLRKWIDERLAWNDVRMTYEAKHWAEALASAKQFLTDFPESRAADSARHVIERSTHELESAPHS
jgi:tetratricopeptide (TPR) repeat protein